MQASLFVTPTSPLLTRKHIPTNQKDLAELSEKMGRVANEYLTAPNSSARFTTYSADLSGFHRLMNGGGLITGAVDWYPARVGSHSNDCLCSGKQLLATRPALEAANSLFNDCFMQDALEHYTAGLLWTPCVPVLPADAPPEALMNKSALAYGNRSVVYHRLRQWEATVAEVDRAIALGHGPFPKRLRLVQRKVECLLNLNRITEAKELFRKNEQEREIYEAAQRAKEAEGGEPPAATAVTLLQQFQWQRLKAACVETLRTRGKKDKPKPVLSSSKPPLLVRMPTPVPCTAYHRWECRLHSCQLAEKLGDPEVRLALRFLLAAGGVQALKEIATLKETTEDGEEKEDFNYCFEYKKLVTSSGGFNGPPGPARGTLIEEWAKMFTASLLVQLLKVCNFYEDDADHSLLFSAAMRHLLALKNIKDGAGGAIRVSKQLKVITPRADLGLEAPSGDRRLDLLLVIRFTGMVFKSSNQEPQPPNLVLRPLSTREDLFQSGLVLAVANENIAPGQALCLEFLRLT
ncbi:SET and MYND domain-containing protein 4 [Tyrophagus putrescentiae]|nr:SET and MYND domain-containing protein 4 [Tyrophagus putrescentiae]